MKIKVEWIERASYSAIVEVDDGIGQVLIDEGGFKEDGEWYSADDYLLELVQSQDPSPIWSQSEVTDISKVREEETKQYKPIEDVPYLTRFWVKGEGPFLRIRPPENDDEFTREGGGVIPAIRQKSETDWEYQPWCFGTLVTTEEP